jgi:hypothetical protein
VKLRALLFALLVLSCGGTTGSGLVTFTAQVGGPADATGGPLTFQTGFGYTVTLTRARLHLGAVYLNEAVPTSGAGASSCVLPSIYVAEVFGPVDVDLLSPELKAFPNPGEGTVTEARTAEVWLTGGDVNAASDPTVILDVAGTAVKGGANIPFQGTVTISNNRAIPVVSSAFPGSNPICKQRIVTPIGIDLTPTHGGVLTLRVQPRGMFQAVDFASLSLAPGSTTIFQIPDANTGAGQALFKGLLSNAASGASNVYQLGWQG